MEFGGLRDAGKWPMSLSDKCLFNLVQYECNLFVHYFVCLRLFCGSAGFILITLFCEQHILMCRTSRLLFSAWRCKVTCSKWVDTSRTCGNHNYHAGKSTFNFTLVLSLHQMTCWPMTESCDLYHLWTVEDTVSSADIKNKCISSWNGISTSLCVNALLWRCWTWVFTRQLCC